MSNKPVRAITDVARAFLEPQNTTHRRYEALRAYFVDELPSAEAAARFGYTPGTFRVMCSKFRQDPHRQFFLTTEQRKAPPPAPKKNLTREQIIALRKRNLSIYDIADALTREGSSISSSMVGTILKEEGFDKLPRRRDEERPPTTKPEIAAVADATQLDLTPRRFKTKFGGLFLFLPYLVDLSFNRIIGQADLPGSTMIPAAHAVRSLLALKLFGNARHTHFMSHVFDHGLGLFAGLNVIPKRSFLTEYSCRVDPDRYPKLMRYWFNAVSKFGLARGVSFDLDFHTIPFHGEDALVQKHYVSKRSRSQKGVLAFLAQDSEKRVFCYANAGVRKEEHNDEILRFVEFWKQRTGRYPEELAFDSKLTTYANLNQLNQRDIKFITLRRRTRKMLRQIYQLPLSAWRQIELKNVKRAYRTPKVLDQRISLTDYDGQLRQLTDLGHEDPTLLITNHLRSGAATLVGRYARRMLIENNIEDAIDFFHMDALSSAVAMKVNFDLQLTLMASSLYRLLGERIGNGYRTAKSRHIFRDFIDATAMVDITASSIDVHFHKRAHNPLLLAAGFADTDVRIPWLGGRRLHLVFG
jgi:hypothetical protein